MTPAPQASQVKSLTAIIGLGVTGESCLRHLAGRRPLAVIDTRDEPPNGHLARERYPDIAFAFGAAAAAFDFTAVDEVIVSPGIALGHALVRSAESAGARIGSDIDLFLDAVGEHAGQPVIAITGTNGKSTVTALTGHLLEALGYEPGVGGNLGEPALDLLNAAHDSFVLELSSFQLERMHSHRFAAATILNVTDDHLDRHGDLEAYAAAKQRVYGDVQRAVVNRRDARTRPLGEVGEIVSFGIDAPVGDDWGLVTEDGTAWLVCGELRLLPLSDLPIAGLHNAENVLAALALVAPADLRSNPAIQARLIEGVRSFRGLPHRCQLVTQVDGVKYVDDSKATNVGAALAALEGLGDPAAPNLVLIAGGDGKGADFHALRPAVLRYVKALVLLGRDAPRMAAQLEGAAPIERVADMAAAVQAARRLASAGDTILLSPACASLDMFENYQARGRAFAAAAEGLR